MLNLDWVERLKKADIICSCCHDSWNESKTGSWRFTGFHWEHKCENLNSSQSYIYALIDPTTNEVKYVGKSNNPQYRFRKHLHDKKINKKTTGKK